MLHRDYFAKLATRFVRVLVPALERVEETGDSLAITEMEGAIAELVELEPVMLLSLTPESLTTFVQLSPQGEGVAPYMVWGLNQVAGTVGALGDEATAELRKAQAETLAEAFGLSPDVVPEAIEELMAEDEVEEAVEEAELEADEDEEDAELEEDEAEEDALDEVVEKELEASD